MHEWGDEGVDWAGISGAANYIHDFCVRWGRFGGQSKEKYGTVRFYCSFNRGSIYDLFYPGYVSYWKMPWICHFDIYYAPKLMKYTGMSWLLWKWQPFIYNLAYQRALKKWPHLRGEILMMADYRELIKGSTRKEGNKEHVIGWNGEILGTWVCHSGSDKTEDSDTELEEPKKE